MLIKRKERQARRGSLAALASQDNNGLDRRTFLRRSGLAAGGLAALGALPLSSVQKAKAGPPPAKGATVTIRKSMCTHCAVGCTVTAEVSNSVWIGQEPSWESPINRGSHCAKGASVRELVMGERRLKYPMKMVNGQWTRIKWDQAINEIGDKLNQIREKSGPDAVYWLGSAKFSNEGTYLFRKLAAFWGTNNQDHQARICHSTTVTGVANTWGYGAMTNSFNDIRNSKTQIIMGGNPAEAHPVSLQHLLEGAELNKANVIVIDPRMTRTAAHATEYVRIRPGTDIPVLWGMLWHVFKNGWEDKEFIKQRVYGMDEARKEIEKYTPEVVENISGVPGAQLERVAKMFATERPSTLIWCMGQTQHTVGTANVRASCIALLATGNVGKPGTGANIFRGHDNVQGATDIGLDVVTLPFYYGLVEGAWKHWSRVWEVDYNWIQGQFDPKQPKKMMETPGIPLTRWFDAVLLPKDKVGQSDNVKAMMVFGHASNSITRIPESTKGMAALELLVVADPHPTTWASLSANAGRKDNTYLLPICTQFETSGSRVASNRSLQWGEQIVPPIFESKDDSEVVYLLAKKFGFEDKMFKNIKVDGTKVPPEDVLREMNRGSWSTGYCGQSPERLKAHMKHQAAFDLVTMRAPKDTPDVGGDYYGLPWPCWGKPEIKHPGTPLLYDTTKSIQDGGGTFRARFGVERNGVSLLSETYSKDSEIKDGYPQFTLSVLKKLGWDTELTPEELATIQKIGGDVAWSTDLSGGIQRICVKHNVIPYGNGKARAIGLGSARSGADAPRADLLAARRPGGEVPDLSGRREIPAAEYRAYCPEERGGQGLGQGVPAHPVLRPLGRIRGRRRGNPFQQVAGRAAAGHVHRDQHSDAAERGIKDGGWVWVTGAENSAKAKMKALVTERVGKGVAWMPFHFGGWYEGEDLRSKYPQGADPDRARRKRQHDHHLRL